MLLDLDLPLARLRGEPGPVTYLQESKENLHKKRDPLQAPLMGGVLVIRALPLTFPRTFAGVERLSIYGEHRGRTRSSSRGGARRARGRDAVAVAARARP
jgi:hypothetical protein